MKRLGLLIIVAALAAGGVVYTVHNARSTPHPALAGLLPRGMSALAHFPDFKQTRDDWHQADLYKLYREPAVQNFLNRPLSKAPHRDVAAETASDFERLDMKDAFIGVTSIDNNNPHLIGGFRFRGSQSEAENVISKWRAKLVRDASVRETVDYQQHKIDIVGAAPNQVATVYDGQWFLASNDLPELKAVLDRADQRGVDPQTILQADETFAAAIKHMPATYGLLFYLQPKKLSESFASVRNAMGAGAQGSVVDQVRSICGAARFDRGKVRSALFIGMPKAQSGEKLIRSSLSLGTSETFFYLVTLLNPDWLAGINQAGLPLGGWLQKVFDATTRAGVTVNDWKAAFDLELGSLADWPQSAHWPSIISTLRVKDLARANKIVNSLTRAIDEDVPWKRSEKDGVAYFYMQTPASILAITPTIALSNQILVVGLDSVSVEAAIKRSANAASTLAGLPNYKTAERAVATPTDAFVYIDTALLYTRLDAALRPMLLMSTAFMPSIADYVDVSKLPPPETVSKHLSPIVSSQRFEGDGYVTDSVGPVTLDIGIALPALVWSTTPGRGH